MKTALITGSETFGQYIINPTKWLALAANGKTIAGHIVHSLVFSSIVRLPEDAEDHGTTIVKKAQEIKADVILSFGMASEVKGFRIERSATNWIYSEKYCPPYEHNKPKVSTQPVKERLRINLQYWNLEKIKTLFNSSDIPYDFHISDDPGQYSCNSWIYQTIRAMKRLKVAIPYIFIHTACTEEAIECIPDFSRDKKILITKKNLLQTLEIFLSSYKSNNPD